MFMEGVGIEQLFPTLISLLGSGSEGFSVTFTALGCLSVSVKAEDGLKRQRRYEILILEKS